MTNIQASIRCFQLSNVKTVVLDSQMMTAASIALHLLHSTQKRKKKKEKRKNWAGL